MDDSALYRQSIANTLRSIDGVQSCGFAKDGVDALAKIEKLDPDLLTLDVQMPGMDGIAVLREIKSRKLRPKAVMVSSLTATGADITTEALMEGAFDFILKPSGSDSTSNRNLLEQSLREKINAFRESACHRGPSSGVSAKDASAREVSSSAGAATSGPVPEAERACRGVIIGTSTGGPAALKTVLAKLPDTIPVPVFVVQHMPPTYTTTLAARLDSICPLHVVEASQSMIARPGQVIVAAGGKQMGLKKRGADLEVQVSEAPSENGVRPSVDYFLRSAVDVFRGDALAVILTGMGRDGLEGCRQLKQAGGFVFAQNRSDCIVYGMPKAVTESGLADRSLPLGKIAPAIVRHIKRSMR